MSPDLCHATAFVLPLGGRNSAEAVKALRRAAPYLRSQLARDLRLRLVPELHFELDGSFDYADRIEKLLRAPGVREDVTGRLVLPEEEDMKEEDSEGEDTEGEDQEYPEVSGSGRL
jgi:ribosome-binding factor A